MADDLIARAEAALSPDARMDAYYYSFRNTGLAVIDSILSAVATAGKAYHHTEEWGEAGTWDDKPTHESRIQSAADESATLVRELVAELKTTRAELNQAVADWGANDEMVLAENHRLAEELKTTRAQLEQRRIETVEQLKALKPRPDLINGVLIRAIGAPSFGAVFELNDDGTWNDFDATTPAGERTAPEDVPLPAFILWEPQETRVDRPRARP